MYFIGSVNIWVTIKVARMKVFLRRTIDSISEILLDGSDMGKIRYSIPGDKHSRKRTDSLLMLAKIATNIRSEF